MLPGITQKQNWYYVGQNILFGKRRQPISITHRWRQVSKNRLYDRMLQLITCFLKEDKGQLKLSVFDLLNQNINVYRYTSESSISDSQTTTLRRYFMLSFIYNIRNFSGGKVGGKDRTFGFW